jgi:hypothetical protein
MGSENCGKTHPGGKRLPVEPTTTTLAKSLRLHIDVFNGIVIGLVRTLRKLRNPGHHETGGAQAT